MASARNEKARWVPPPYIPSFPPHCQLAADPQSALSETSNRMLNQFLIQMDGLGGGYVAAGKPMHELETPCANQYLPVFVICDL